MFRTLKLVLPLSLALAATAAQAETAVTRSVIVPPASAKGGEVRVQVHVNFFVPGAIDDSEAAFKAQEGARRKLYESAARECGVLQATIAADCRVEQISININVNRSYGNRMGEGFNASGNFAFRVTLK